MKVLLLVLYTVHFFISSVSEVFITDEKGRALSNVIGPLNEGSRLSLYCETNGGVPSALTWWRDNLLLDDSFSSMPRGAARNELTLAHLDRGDFMSTLTCQSSIPNSTEGTEKSVSLDLNLRPTSVRITSLARPLPAGRPVLLRCESRGSRPPAALTWWLGSRQLFGAAERGADDGSASELRFVPAPEDRGRVLSCRARNPALDGHVIEDHRKLDVHYAPVASVTVGAPRSPLAEGDAATLACHVTAHPPPTAVEWRRDGRPLRPDPTAGVRVREDGSLLLADVRRGLAGNFSCVAANAEGEGASEEVALDVHYRPECAPGLRLRYGVPLRRSVRVECAVRAHPASPLRFRWFLNSSLGRTEALDGFAVRGARSVLTYAPRGPGDYGRLACLAENSAGRQLEPCCFDVHPAGVPGAVADCAVANETSSSASVACRAGPDGGLPQIFHLELYGARGLVASAEVARGPPVFEVGDLPAGASLIAVVFATNELGRSNAVALTVLTKPDAPRGEKQQKPPISPVLASLITVIGALVSVAVVILVCSKQWSARLGEDIPETPTAWEPGDLKPGVQYM